MKFKFLRGTNDNYGDFAGDDDYYRGGYDDTDDMDGEDGFGTVNASSAPVSPEDSMSSAPSNTVSLKIVNPKGYEDAAEIADYLLNGNTVLLNIEKLARDQAIRLLDYLSGATRMVGGFMTKVGKTTIVVAPKNVDVSSIEAMVNGD